jgi:hypothetical protein
MVTVIIDHEEGRYYIVYFLGDFYRVDKDYVRDIHGREAQVAIADLTDKVQTPYNNTG